MCGRNVLFGPSGNLVDLVIESVIVIAADFPQEDAMEFAGVQGFKGVKLGRAFAKTRLEDTRAVLVLLQRNARQAILLALVMRQNRAHLNVEKRDFRSRE